MATQPPSNDIAHAEEIQKAKGESDDQRHGALSTSSTYSRVGSFRRKASTARKTVREEASTSQKPLLELFFFLLKLSFGNWKKAEEAFPLMQHLEANIKTTQAANCWNQRLKQALNNNEELSWFFSKVSWRRRSKIQDLQKRICEAEKEHVSADEPIGKAQISAAER